MENVSIRGKHKDLIRGNQVLMGFINAILEDNLIDKLELMALADWIELHRSDLQGTSPFDEIDDLVFEGLHSPEDVSDDIFDELQDFFERLNFAINTLRSNPNVQDKVRELRGMMMGMKADGVINLEEAKMIEKWVKG